MTSLKGNFIINKSYDPLIFRTVIKRYWWWPALFMLLLFGAAFFYLRYTKPVFESSLILQLASQDNAKDIIEIENINAQRDNYFSDIELMRSQLLFEQAIGSMNMNVSLFSKGEILTEEKYLSSSFNIQPYSLSDSSLVGVPVHVEYDGSKVRMFYSKNNKEIELNGKLGDHFVNADFDVVIKSPHPQTLKEESENNELYFTFNTIESLTNRLMSGLIVAPVDQAAQTVSISYRGHNPQLCKDISMAMAKSFMEYSDKIKKQGSENILTFIDQQLDSLSLELKKSKDSLMEFQRMQNLPDPESVSTSIRENVDKIQDELFQMEDEIRTLAMIDSKLNETPNRLDVYRILPELLGKSYEAAIAGHIEALHTLLEEKEDLLFKLTEESTEVKRVDKKIQERIRQIRRSIEAIEARLSARANVLRTKIYSLEGDYFSLPEKRMEYTRLKNIQDLNEKYVQLLTEKKVLYSISDAGFASNNRILNKASVNPDPVAPNSRLVYATFLFFGLFLGLAVLFVKYVSFNEINLLEDLENLLPEKASILGGIPLFKFNLEYSQLIVTDSPKSMMAEAMRKIRVNLSYIQPDYQTIAISSSISGEGKTFVALNLAGIIAMSGKKTVIMDLDMRKPKIHLGFDVHNTHGMSSLIVGQSKIDDCIHPSGSENLDFITAGPVPPNPSELLISPKFHTIIEELKKRYDVIVIDNPPVGLVSDGIDVLTKADIPIYVFKSHYSRRNFTYRVKELFEMQQLKSLNVILNGVKSNKRSVYGYGYGYGGYGYGYGDGYMDEDDETKYKTQNKFGAFLRKLFRRNEDH